MNWPTEPVHEDEAVRWGVEKDPAPRSPAMLGRVIWIILSILIILSLVLPWILPYLVPRRLPLRDGLQVLILNFTQIV